MIYMIPLLLLVLYLYNYNGFLCHACPLTSSVKASRYRVKVIPPSYKVKQNSHAPGGSQCVSKQRSLPNPSSASFARRRRVRLHITCDTCQGPCRDLNTSMYKYCCIPGSIYGCVLYRTLCINCFVFGEEADPRRSLLSSVFLVCPLLSFFVVFLYHNSSFRPPDPREVLPGVVCGGVGW